jgi:hypothetical protein
MKFPHLLSLCVTLLSAGSLQAVDFSGNGNGGFGGVIGQGQLTLTDDGTTLSGTITRGSDLFKC